MPSRDLDQLERDGLCLGSGMRPRAFDLSSNEGMCPHCGEYVALADLGNYATISTHVDSRRNP